MKRLDLEFRSRRPASRRGRWLLLGVAVAFGADLGVSYHGVREAIAVTEQRLAQLGRRQDGAGRTGATPVSFSAEEVALARETFGRLSIPWDDLFGALESTPTEKVVLLAIEPDPGSGKVVISGEGQDYLAVLSYVLNLRRSSTLADVHLVKHERRQNGAQQPVTFSVSASWSRPRQ